MSRGRPTLRPDNLAQRMAEHLAAGGTLTELADRMGVSRKSILRWRQSHKPTRATGSPPVTVAPTTAAVFSLAAWGVPLRPIAADGIEPTLLTEDDVDDMLARAA